MTIDRQTLRWNGWGLVTQENPYPDGAAQWIFIRDALGMKELPSTPAKRFTDISLPKSRLDAEAISRLKEICGNNQVRDDDYERAFHARGKSYHDLLYVRAGKLEIAPDAAVYPRSPEEVEQVMTFCLKHKVALVPFGGGSSVVGGVTAESGSLERAVITLDMTLMNRVLKIDKKSMTATVQAGIYGPHLEKALQEHGVTLGHYPQSFQFSTLGGWIAARGAGQQSNRYGKAEKWLVAAKLVTPKGVWQTEDYPASAAGPNMNQIVAGSEGTLGVICEATVKIHEVPQVKDYRGYLFKDFKSGARAVRAINHADVPVAMVRLSDAPETFFFQAAGSSSGGGLKAKLQGAYLKMKGLDAPCLMLIGLEGDKETVAYARQRTAAIAQKHGATAIGASAGRKWFHGRFDGPHIRDPLMDRGIGVDTLETSTHWANILPLHEKVSAAITKAMTENVPETGQRGIVMGHISHSYPDGASLYFTYIFPRKLEDEAGQWLAIKRAASDAILEGGGTISHHHGVGTDHAPWLVEEKGARGVGALQALKKEFDPEGLLNPGKLLG